MNDIAVPALIDGFPWPGPVTDPVKAAQFTRRAQMPAIDFCRRYLLQRPMADRIVADELGCGTSPSLWRALTRHDRKDSRKDH